MQFAKANCQAGKPYQNCYIERFNGTYRNEALNRYIFESLDEIRDITDDWLIEYNYKRPHSGKYCYGKTPYQTFLESKHIAIEKTIDENSKINDDEKEISDSLNC